MHPEVQVDPAVQKNKNLKSILENNLEEIIAKYSCYTVMLCFAVEEMGVPLKELREFLLGLSAVDSHYKGRKISLVSGQEAELEKKKTIRDIFNFLKTQYASFVNCGIFEKIRLQYGVADDRVELQYAENLKAYINKHKIEEFVQLNPFLKDTRAGVKELIVKFDVESTCRLAKVIELENSLAKIFCLLPDVVDIAGIAKGCVVVTFLIPTSAAEAVFTPDTISTLREQLRAASVLWLKYNGTTYPCHKEIGTGN